jgi:FSR family fosmidomycin resistance protein-like MFS transporter
VIVIPVVTTYGLEATPLFVVPGLLVALLLWFAAPKTSVMKKAVPAPILPALRTTWFELSKLMLVVASRSLAYFGFVAFLPLYLKLHNVSIAHSGYILFTMLFAGAIGGVIGGYVSDKLGRRAVIAGSLILATPFFYLFLHANGFMRFFYLSLAGASLLASFSVTVVMAQEIISKNAALASGLTLGFGIGIGGLGVGLLGVVADNVGLAYVINMLVWFPLFSGLVAFSLKKNRKKSLDYSQKHVVVQNS